MAFQKKNYENTTLSLHDKLLRHRGVALLLKKSDSGMNLNSLDSTKLYHAYIFLLSIVLAKKIPPLQGVMNLRWA